jgi:hypothetical protein
MSPPDISVESSGFYPVTAAVGWAGELLAEAGLAVAGLAEPMTVAVVGESLAPILARVAAAYRASCLELVEATSQLSTLLDATVRCYLSVDSEAAYRFGPVTVHG